MTTHPHQACAAVDARAAANAAPSHPIVDGVFSAYKRVLSPVLHSLSLTPAGCCYQPSCSEYAALALAEHGPVRGGLMAIWRVLRCNPFTRGGWDPVPPARRQPPAR